MLAKEQEVKNLLDLIRKFSGNSEFKKGFLYGLLVNEKNCMEFEKIQLSK